MMPGDSLNDGISVHYMDKYVRDGKKKHYMPDKQYNATSKKKTHVKSLKYVLHNTNDLLLTSQILVHELEIQKAEVIKDRADLQRHSLTQS